MEIARFKAHKDGIDFSDEVLEYICKYVSNNVQGIGRSNDFFTGSGYI